MRIPIELDDHILAQVKNIGWFATKKETVNTALAEYLGDFLERLYPLTLGSVDIYRQSPHIKERIAD